MSATNGAADIFIIGLGTVVGWQITREAEYALRNCRKAFYLDAGFGCEEYLRSLNADVTDLHPLSYREGEPRHTAYDRMSAAVLQAALDTTPVAFAVYGHPKVYVYPTDQIISAAELLGLRVKVLPGISSLDTMFIDLSLDPGQEGLQMYEATDLLARDRPLQADVPAIIWQVGVVGSGLYSERQSLPARFIPLQDHLLKFYPPAHKVTIVKSADHALMKRVLTECEIRNLPEHLATAPPVASLYVPVVQHRPVRQSVAETVDSISYLNLVSTP